MIPASNRAPVEMPKRPSARRIYSILLSLWALGLLMQTFQSLISANPMARQAAWRVIVQNLPQSLAAGVWLWFFLAPRYQYQRSKAGWGGLIVRGFVGYFVVYALAFFVSNLARNGMEGGIRALQLWDVLLLSLFSNVPIAFIVQSTFALLALNQEQRWDTARAIEAAERARQQAEASRIAAELRAIRTYLRPHFLFNMLNTVASLIETEPERAQKAVVMTSTLLRASLASSAETGELVPLEDELALACRYLELEQLRMEERLRFDFEVHESTRACWVPRFLIQTLVENAVRHGLFRKRGGGSVTVRVSPDAEQLVVTVSDSGLGGDAAQVAASPGFGLRSLRERLQSQYGSAASLSIDTQPLAGFVATARIPSERIPIDPMPTA